MLSVYVLLQCCVNRFAGKAPYFFLFTGKIVFPCFFSFFPSFLVTVLAFATTIVSASCVVAVLVSMLIVRGGECSCGAVIIVVRSTSHRYKLKAISCR